MTIDILIIVGITAYGVLGFRDGALKKMFSIIGFWGGLICATKLMYPLGSSFSQWFNLNKVTSNFVAFYLIFVLITGTEYLLYKRFAPASDGLKLVPRIGGLILGIVQGSLIISLIILLLAIINVPSEKAKEESLLYDTFFHAAPTFFDITFSWSPTTKTFLEEIESNFRTIKK
jgi:uncharacterized membrane protein required for colicin V production